MSGGNSSLRAAMKKKTAAKDADGIVKELAAADKTGLSLAPPPAEDAAGEGSAEPADENHRGVGSPPAARRDEPAADLVNDTPGPDEAATDSSSTMPQPADDPEAGMPTDPEPIETPAAVPPATTEQTAKVLATGVGAPARAKAPSPKKPSAPDMKHLAQVMKMGRSNHRRYVEDQMPARSGRGTNVRLPVHLQDVLAEYCDQRYYPMADLIAAVLDGYFRDIGALPPMGEGHQPVPEFFDELRLQARRTYDY